MIDAKKVRAMTKLSVYENGEGRQDLKINRYKKSTYLALKLLESAVAVTAAYLFGAALFSFRYYTQVSIQGLEFPYQKLLFGGIILYLVIFTVYMLSSAGYYRKKYDRMKDNVKEYDKELYILKKYIRNARKS